MESKFGLLFQFCILGQDEYKAIRDHVLKSSDGVVLVYSVTSPLNDIKKDAKSIVDYFMRAHDLSTPGPTQPKFPIVLAINRVDLEQSSWSFTELDAESMAQELNRTRSVPLLHLSVQTHSN